jgi:hypothetical protein
LTFYDLPELEPGISVAEGESAATPMFPASRLRLGYPKDWTAVRFDPACPNANPSVAGGKWSIG